MNKDGTDVYFHVVNRTTGKVLPYQDEWVKRYKTILKIFFIFLDIYFLKKHFVLQKNYQCKSLN